MKLNKICILSISLLLIGSLSGCSPKETKEEKVLKYLENKYNEGFVMETFYDASEHKFDFQYSGGEGIAYSINNQNIPFHVSISTNADKEIYDNYSLMKLSSQLDDDFKEILNNNLDYKSNCKTKISSSKDGKEYDNAKEFLNENKNETIIHTDIIIEVDSIEDVENSYEAIYKTLQEIKSYEPKSYSLNVGYVRNIEKENIKEFFRKSGLITYSWDEIYNDMYGDILVNNTYEINSPNDLKERVSDYEH